MASLLSDPVEDFRNDHSPIDQHPGQKSCDHPRGRSYTDLGAIVTDNQGHDLSYRTFINGVSSGNILIDTSRVATDTIDYVATDTWGNTATSTRTVIIEPASSSPSI
jgi:hypothetical protein